MWFTHCKALNLKIRKQQNKNWYGLHTKAYYLLLHTESLTEHVPSTLAVYPVTCSRVITSKNRPHLSVCSLCSSACIYQTALLTTIFYLTLNVPERQWLGQGKE